MERLAKVKYTKIFGVVVSDEESQGLKTLTPGANVMKLFKAISYDFLQ
jgi:hypothetical protein